MLVILKKVRELILVSIKNFHFKKKMNFCTFLVFKISKIRLNIKKKKKITKHEIWRKFKIQKLTWNLCIFHPSNFTYNFTQITILSNDGHCFTRPFLYWLITITAGNARFFFLVFIKYPYKVILCVCNTYGIWVRIFHKIFLLAPLALQAFIYILGGHILWNIISLNVDIYTKRFFFFSYMMVEEVWWSASRTWKSLS